MVKCCTDNIEYVYMWIQAKEQYTHRVPRYSFFCNVYLFVKIFQNQPEYRTDFCCVAKRRANKIRGRQLQKKFKDGAMSHSDQDDLKTSLNWLYTGPDQTRPDGASLTCTYWAHRMDWSYRLLWLHLFQHQPLSTTGLIYR